jgi:hypothetical protein
MDALDVPGLRQLVMTQHGLVAVWQLYQLGLVRWQIRSIRERGQLVSCRRGVLLLPGTPESPQRPLLAACVAVGPEAVASHWAAAGLLGLKGCAAGTLEITIPRRRRTRLDGVRIHKVTDPLAKEDRTRHDGVPVTSPARTVLDLASTEASAWLVERMLDDAGVRKLLTQHDMAATLERAGPLHRGRSVLVPILKARRHEWGQRFDSLLELRIARVLRVAGIPPGAMHRLVGTPGGIYEIDFAWPDRQAGLDAHGFEPHGTRSALDHDARRGHWLLRAGWHVVVVTAAMSDDEVVNAARTVLGADHAALS